MSTVLVCVGVGCASAAPVVTTPVPEPEAPGSLLVAESLPAPVVREPGLVAVGTPLFQVGHAEAIQAIDISPDGRLALLAGFDGTVSVLDVETGVTRATRRLWVSYYRGGLTPVRFDASGTRVLLNGSGPPYRDTLVVWDLLTDTLQPGHASGTESVVSASLSSDGAWVVGLSGPMLQVRRTADLVTRSAHLLLRDGRQPLLPNQLWLSPSSERIVAAHDAVFEQTDIGQGRPQLLQRPVPALHLYDPDGTHVARMTPGQVAESEDDVPEDPAAPVGFRQVGFRPSGGMLMTLTGAGAVELRHPLTGDSLHRVALPAPAIDAQWSRAGELLFVREGDGSSRVHFVDPATGTPTATVDADWPLESLRDADGSLLIYSLRSLQAFSAAGEERPHPLEAYLTGETRLDLFRVTADGGRAAYLQGGVIHFVDLRRRVELAQRTLTQGPPSVWGALWVPNVGVIMTTRSRGVLFRPGAASPVHCAAAGAELRGEGRTLRVHSGLGQCSLDDTSEPAPTELVYDRHRLVFAASADRSTQVSSLEDGSYVVEDAATGRLRMRVPAAARTSPACPDCPATYALSDDGAVVAVYDASLPLTLYETRTGRRLARLESRDHTVEWVTFHPDASAFVVSWRPADELSEVEPEDDAARAAADEARAARLRQVVAYDRRGRELAKLELRVDAAEGDPGAAFSGTQLALFFEREVRIVDLRSRAVTALAARGRVLEAAWHGPALRLVVRGDDGQADFDQDLYAPGATTPYAQFEGPGDFTADARFVFRCRQGELERTRVEDLTRTVFGTCLETSLFPSPDGRFVAMPQGDHLRVVREDGMAVRLAAITGTGAFLAFGVEEATGRFTVAGTTPSETRLTYRRAGPATEAPVVQYGEVMELIEPDLLQRFFGL